MSDATMTLQCIRHSPAISSTPSPSVPTDKTAITDCRAKASLFWGSSFSARSKSAVASSTRPTDKDRAARPASDRGSSSFIAASGETSITGG